MKALQISAQVALAAFVLVAGASLAPSSSQAGSSVVTDGIVQKNGADNGVDNRRGRGADNPNECIVDDRCVVGSNTFERGGHDDGPGHP